MFVPYILLPALTGAVIGVAVGCFIPHITKKIISYKCRQRGKPEPQSLIPKWIKLLCVLAMIILSAGVVGAGSSLLGGMFRYKAFFVIAFIAIAMVISLTDCYIHLIPNESVLLLLGLGIIYRILFDGPSGLLDALLALGLALLIFGGSSVIFFLIKGRTGLGAGDLKYVFAVSIIIGTSGMIPFLSGMAVVILFYVFVVMGRHLLLLNDYFPMAAHLSCGLLVALLIPYVDAAQEYIMVFL